MASSDYDWHPAPGVSTFKVESTRNLGWWILLALLVSVIAHMGLYMVLGGMDWMAGGPAAGTEPIQLAPKERLIMDSDKLDALLPENEAILEEVSKPEKLSDTEDLKLDEFDVFEKLKDEVLRMSPVETPQLFNAESPQMAAVSLGGPEAGSLDVSTAKVLANDLAQMREKLVETSNVVSNAQAVMTVNSDEINTGLDTDEFFKDAVAKAKGNSKNGDSALKGLTTLGDLIGNTGGKLPSGEKTVVMPTDILFEYNEYKLKEMARISMMKLAFIVQTNPDAEFIIEGHTDSFGADEYNNTLSMNRARAVREWLVEKLQLPVKNVRVVGLGKNRPLVSVEGTAEEQALNRRVEIVIKKK